MESIINAFKKRSIIIQDKLSHASINELHRYVKSQSAISAILRI